MAIHTMREKIPGSISEAIATCEESRDFKGCPKTGASADISGRLPTEPPEDEPVTMSGHPAEEPEEPETETEEGEPSRAYASYEEAVAAATETEQKVDQLRQELEEIQQLAYQTIVGQDQGQAETPTVETAGEFPKKRRKQALDEIEGLDPDDEDHKGKVAEIQAKADEDIRKWYREEDEKLETRRAEYRSEVGSIIDQAQKAMEAAGLDSEKGSPDSTLFWSLSQICPTTGKDGQPIPISNQIHWCIDTLRQYKVGQQREAGGPKEEESDSTDRPVSLSSIIDEIAGSRRA